MKIFPRPKADSDQVVERRMEFMCGLLDARREEVLHIAHYGIETKSDHELAKRACVYVCGLLANADKQAEFPKLSVVDDADV